MRNQEKPTEKILKKLPRWGRVAVIARALRRTMPLIAEMLDKKSKNILQSIEFALIQSEDSAAKGKVAEHLLWACNRLIAKMKSEYESSDHCDDSYTIDALTAAYNVVQCCLESDAEPEMAAIEAISNVVFNFECYKDRKVLTKAADKNVNADLDYLLGLSKKAELKFDAPVPVAAFGELWPRSKPKGWPNESRETSARATFKRPRSNRKALSVLPEEVVQLLEQNPNYTIESESLECGRIVLNKPEYLELSKHFFSMNITDWADRDPNQNASGNYVLTTIELVCYCEHYRPSGKLCWFVEYECCGCYDLDLGTVFLFRGVSWKSFLASADSFIQSPWDVPKKPVVILSNPWERLSFKKSKSASNSISLRSDDQIVAELIQQKGAERLIDAEYNVCRRQPLDEVKVAAVEKALGYTLPPLLKRMYCEVANGGYGESYGLIGLVGGARDDTSRDVQQLLRVFQKPDKEDPKWKWPEGLLPAFYEGCGMYLCVDCRHSRGRVIQFDPNNHQDDRSWSNSFRPLWPSLAKFICEWLDAPHVHPMLRRNPDAPPTPMKALLKGLVGSVELRRTAAYELGFHNADDAIPILVKLLNDSDELVRVYAIQAMVNLKNKSVVSVLIDYATQPQPGLVLTNTIRALAELGDESAESVLCKFLSAKDSMVRYDAIFALGEIADESVIPALSRLTSDKTMPNSGEDEATIWSIGELAKRAIHKIEKRQLKAARRK